MKQAFFNPWEWKELGNLKRPMMDDAKEYFSWDPFKQPKYPLLNSYHQSSTFFPFWNFLIQASILFFLNAKMLLSDLSWRCLRFITMVLKNIKDLILIYNQYSQKKIEKNWITGCKTISLLPVLSWTPLVHYGFWNNRE